MNASLTGSDIFGHNIDGRFFTVVSHGRGGAERLRPVRPDSPLVVTVLYFHARFRLV